jgi:hypothetical protein
LIRCFNSIALQALALAAVVACSTPMAMAACEPLENSNVPVVPLRELGRLSNPGGIVTVSWNSGDDSLSVRYLNGDTSVLDLTKTPPVLLGPVASPGHRYGMMRVASTGEFIEPRGKELIRYDARTLEIVGSSPFSPPNTKHTFILAGKPERAVMLPEGHGTGPQAVLGLAYSLDGKLDSSWGEIPQPAESAGRMAPNGEYMVRTAKASDARRHFVVWSFHSGNNRHRARGAPPTVAMASIERDQAAWPPKVQRFDLSGVWRGFGELVASPGGSFLLGAAQEKDASDHKVDGPIWPLGAIWPVGFASSTLWTKTWGPYVRRTIHFTAMPEHFPSRNGFGDKRISDDNQRIYVLSHESERPPSPAGRGAITAYAFNGTMMEYCSFRAAAPARMSWSGRFVAIVHDQGATVYKVGHR